MSVLRPGTGTPGLGGVVRAQHLNKLCDSFDADDVSDKLGCLFSHHLAWHAVAGHQTDTHAPIAYSELGVLVQFALGEVLASACRHHESL